MQKEFRCITRTVQTPFKINLALDYGDKPGLWAVFVIGTWAFGFGYLPKLKYMREAPRAKKLALAAVST